MKKGKQKILCGRLGAMTGESALFHVDAVAHVRAQDIAAGA